MTLTIADDQQDRENRFGRPVGKRAAGVQQPHQPGLLLLVHGRGPEVRQRAFLEQHDVGWDERHRADPRDHDADGNEDAEHLHRRNRRQCQRGKPRRRGQRRVEHRHEQVIHDLERRLAPALLLRVQVEEFRKDVHRVHHCNRHQKDRDHRTHDVDGIAQPDQRPHRGDHGDHRHNHRGDDQHELAEEHQHEDEDHQHGQRCRDRHLHEHLVAEGIFRHGQTRNVVLLVSLKPGDLVVESPVQLVADMLGGQRDVDTQGLAVLGDHGAVQQRVGHRLVADLQGLGLRGRRLGHEPLEFDHTRTALADVVHQRRSHQVHLNDALVRVLRAAPGLGELGQLVDLRQRRNVEHAVRVLLVHHTQNDDVVQHKVLFGQVVKDADGLVLREHVLRVRIDLDQRDQRTQRQGKDHQQRGDQLVMPQRKVGYLLLAIHVLRPTGCSFVATLPTSMA